MRSALAAAFLAMLVAMLYRLNKNESELGRFAALTGEGEITRKWLEQHVFSYLPEVAGAAWDNTTSGPEVAATLARLVQEKKLSSEVKSTKVLLGEDHILHLTLNVDRREFTQHERTLIDVLFEPNSIHTDTDSV